MCFFFFFFFFFLFFVQIAFLPLDLITESLFLAYIRVTYLYHFSFSLFNIAFFFYFF